MSNEQKIRNTFDRMYGELERFQKVVREGGQLEAAMMELGGDIAWLRDIETHISALLNSLEEAEYSALANDMEEGVNESKKLVEGVLDSDDEDGFMARSQLYFLARDAIQLHGMIDDRDNLEPWVQTKIAQASKDMDSVRRYTEYNAAKVDAVEEPVVDVDVDEGFSVLPNIDRERYQERDGLEGPFRTKSGKVVYYDTQEGAYYDPDTDFYLTYDEWKALDENANLFKQGANSANNLAKSAVDMHSKADAAMANSPVAKTQQYKDYQKTNMANKKAAMKQGMPYGRQDIGEGEERPYVCVHAKKGKYECSAESSYGAAKKAAEHWKLKSTAGIDAYLADIEHTAEGVFGDIGKAVKDFVNPSLADQIKRVEQQLYLAKNDMTKSGWSLKDVPNLEQKLAKLKAKAGVTERKMTSAEKSKEERLKDKYDDSGMKKSMQDQYGDEEGMKVYFASLRKKAMQKGAK